MCAGKASLHLYPRDCSAWSVPSVHCSRFHCSLASKSKSLLQAVYHCHCLWSSMQTSLGPVVSSHLLCPLPKLSGLYLQVLLARALSNWHWLALEMCPSQICHMNCSTGRLPAVSWSTGAGGRRIRWGKGHSLVLSRLDASSLSGRRKTVVAMSRGAQILVCGRQIAVAPGSAGVAGDMRHRHKSCPVSVFVRFSITVS